MKNYLFVTFALVIVLFSVFNCSCTIDGVNLKEPYENYLDSISICRTSIYKYQDSISAVNNQIKNIDNNHNKVLALKNKKSNKKNNAPKAQINDTINKVPNDSIKSLLMADKVKDSLNAIKEIQEDSINRIKIYQDSISYNENIKTCKGKIKNFEATIKNLEKILRNYIRILQNEMKIKSGAFVFKYMNVKYKMYVYDRIKDSLSLSFDLVDSNNNHFTTFDNYRKYLNKSKYEPLMITNAGMFSSNQDPQGLFINKSRNLCFETDTSHPITDGNFYLMPNGILYIDSLNHPKIISTDDFVANNIDIHTLKFATQSGPMLLRNGNKNPNLKDRSNNKKIRSGVGVFEDNKLVFICSDGPENFWLFTQLFQDLFDCKNVLFLDGAISGMYLKDVDESDRGGFYGPMISVSKKK
jgi:uncharacterized protein YigE (DUF2233 family)